ncbi:unnamed protein product [Boreogadus saida]
MMLWGKFLQARSNYPPIYVDRERGHGGWVSGRWQADDEQGRGAVGAGGALLKHRGDSHKRGSYCFDQAENKRGIKEPEWTGVSQLIPRPAPLALASQGSESPLPSQLCRPHLLGGNTGWGNIAQGVALKCRCPTVEGARREKVKNIQEAAGLRPRPRRSTLL